MLGLVFWAQFQFSDLSSETRSVQPVLELGLDTGLQLLGLVWCQAGSVHHRIPLTSMPEGGGRGTVFNTTPLSDWLRGIMVIRLLFHVYIVTST